MSEFTSMCLRLMNVPLCRANSKSLHSRFSAWRHLSLMMRCKTFEEIFGILSGSPSGNTTSSPDARAPVPTAHVCVRERSACFEWNRTLFFFSSVTFPYSRWVSVSISIVRRELGLRGGSTAVILVIRRKPVEAICLPMHDDIRPRFPQAPIVSAAERACFWRR